MNVERMNDLEFRMMVWTMTFMDIFFTPIDTFFTIRDQKSFLTELRRISKPEATLIIDDGHQPRSRTNEQIHAAGGWAIIAEMKDHLTCKPA